MKEPDYCSPLLTGSIGIMFFLFFAAILLGPVYCHYINLFALAITLAAVIILIRNFKVYSFSKKIRLLLLLMANLTAGIYLAYIRYGYINWHYVDLLQLEP